MYKSVIRPATFLVTCLHAIALFPLHFSLHKSKGMSAFTLTSKRFASQQPSREAPQNPAGIPPRAFSGQRKDTTLAQSTAAASSTNALRAVSARERTVAIHGIAHKDLDVLALALRHCGHIESMTPSKRSPTTIFVVFGTAHAAASAAQLQNCAQANGQRFAVSTNASPADETDPEAAESEGPTAPSASTSRQEPTSSPDPVSSSVRVKLPTVRFSYLSALPFADRWLLPILVTNGDSTAEQPQMLQRKRVRDP